MISNRMHPYTLRGVMNYQQDMEKLALECLRILADIYSPYVGVFMLELAMKRGRLQQLRDLVGMGLNADDIRRLIISEIYYPPRMITALIGQDMTNFVWEIPYWQRGRFGNIWQRLRFRLRWKARRRKQREH